MTATVSPSTVEQARTSHRLQLPRDTDPAAVLTMVRNLHPEASTDAEGAIQLGDGLRLVPDGSPRGAGRWTLDTPRVREDPQPEGMGDSHGYGRAFPDGVPFGTERQGLDLAWSLGRRLYGAVVTDDGVRLEPHPFHIRDLTVVSPYALAPESLAELLGPLEPEAELDQVPEDAPRVGYSVTIPLPAGEEISLRVGRSSRPMALQALGWLEDAVDYELVHLPADPEEDAIESPESGTSERWQTVYRRIGMIAGLLTESVGGFVVDLEGFLVDPADLV
ncbi:hypothetical protein CFK38_05970 [Brachybacterium vulturis]|uniref:Uncharacterized protein n=1 Tax=Brachybacterium vulturis TaxID=2017484 RepID=A0A291GLA5_9MICO|nr:hypothetical protein [Brachybacterium vulturis]ATG51129.1 hypothetical protein CFK38_05970 [Brachybacterium vulturis]